MPTGRVIPHRLPACPGRDSRHTIKRNFSRPENPWWVFYADPGGDLPADDPHTDLVDLVNSLKQQEGNPPGGGFSINEHGQVIARMKAPPGHRGNAIHVVGHDQGTGVIATYSTPITFQQGQLDPTSTPQEGAPWRGPRCGITYTFAISGNPKPPSRNLDEVWTEIEGRICQLSVDAGISPYPPSSGPLANFLKALRRQLPNGGRFRVNEHGRAFTADGTIYIGRVINTSWFRPLTPRS